MPTVSRGHPLSALAGATLLADLKVEQISETLLHDADLHPDHENLEMEGQRRRMALKLSLSIAVRNPGGIAIDALLPCWKRHRRQWGHHHGRRLAIIMRRRFLRLLLLWLLRVVDANGDLKDQKLSVASIRFQKLASVI